MAKIGKIAPIRKEYTNSAFKTIDSALASYGYIRVPGTMEGFLPYREPSGKYRTGLDPEAGYLWNLADEDREAEIKRINEDLEFIRKNTNGLDVSPNSFYYNFGATDKQLESQNLTTKVQMVKLGNEEITFDLSDPHQLITWRWLSVNPRIAPSIEASRSGNYPMAKYYIANDSLEQINAFQKKKKVNSAKAELEKMTPTRRKQIARLMGLPVSDDSTEELVYNEIDTSLQKGELEGNGILKGTSSLNLFMELVSIEDGRLKVKDMVKQAIQHSIYRYYLGDNIYEGENKVAGSEKELVEMLLHDKHQDVYLALEKKLKQKKVLAA